MYDAVDKLIPIVTEIHRARYPEAKVVFLAGSIIRGDGTVYSDLDLVVVYQSLPCAYRESFYFAEMPVEAFVYDTETLHFFLTESDRQAGIPSLAQMISEGIEVPAVSEFSQVLKTMAHSVLAAGPPILSQENVDDLRYQITGLVDDIRDPRSSEELLATGTELYEQLANFYLRTQGRWSAKNKSIPRILRTVDPLVCDRFVEAFDQLFIHGRAEDVIGQAEELLKEHGGFLFDGHRRDAPHASRKPLRS